MIPKMSIITVCLNNIKGLKKTRDSIKKQNFRNFEWIVIDGNSCDGTYNFLNSIKDEVIFKSEPDIGIYDAMNKGIDIACGEYLVFLNAGDYFYNKNVLKNIYSDFTADIVVGRINIVYPYNKKEKIRRIDKQDIRKKYLYHKAIPHQASFIKRILFDIYGGYDCEYKICGDRDFFYRALKNGSTLRFSNVCVATYSMDGISTVMRDTKMYTNEMRRYREKNFSKIYIIKRIIIDYIEKKININQL